VSLNLTNNSTPPSGVELPNDHPGVSDPAYIERRNLIASASADLLPGSPPPRIDYVETEHEVWATVSRALARLHAA
jgi:phenylalanine-4-hydroxylase